MTTHKFWNQGVHVVDSLVACQRHMYGLSARLFSSQRRILARSPAQQADLARGIVISASKQRRCNWLERAVYYVLAVSGSVRVSIYWEGQVSVSRLKWIACIVEFTVL